MKIKVIRLNFCIIGIILVRSTYIKADDKTGQIMADSSGIVVTPKVYSNMLARKREEHKLFVKHLLKSDYNKNYKMLNLGFEKIFEILNESNITLNQAMYIAKNGFPTEERLQSAVTLILENICLSGEIVLHFPEISHSILKKRQNWQDIFFWGINFVNEFPHIIAEDTATMLNLFLQEINENERSEDFINPYKSENITSKNKININKKKAKKKRIKGPQLSRSEL